ncbi:MAG: hypothetical protein KDN22_10080 [Verrucomicrobiae bacterium]|nr:hypothetical protein [Verrucomicrobiae bacterium]
MTSNFSELFPEIVDQARDLHGALSGVAMVILFAGLVLSGWRGSLGGDSSEMLRAVVSTGILACVIHFFPDWADALTGVSHALVDQLDSDPSQSHEEFARLLTGADEADDVGFWDVLWSDEGGIGRALIYAIILLLGKIAFLIMWLGYLLQHVIAAFAIAVSPGFLAMFALNATRGVAVKFVLSFFGILLWPLGWAAADIMTDALLKMAADNNVYNSTGSQQEGSATQTLSFILALSIWIPVSTIAAPRLISRAIQEGSQIGTALLGSFGASLGQGMSYGVGAGVTASLAGASGGAAGSAAIAGGAGGLVSGAMGSSGVLVPAAIGTMAVAAAAPSPRGGGDVNAEAAAIAHNNR